jgi:protein-export SecD/SecF family membrane protein
MAKRSFARAGVKARPFTFFVVSGIILLAMILAWTGLTVPVPGQNEFVEIYGARDIRFGVDIVGGVEAVFAARDFEGTPSADELASARNVLELRMDNLQILDREITVERSKGRIIVRFPWKSGETTFNPDEALTELGEMARLTFRDPDGNVIMDGTEISKSMAAYDPNTNDPIVSLEMTSEGADKFGEATARLIGQPIYIFMDEVQISAPTVNSAIYNGKAVIENIGTAEEAIDLAEKINAGALPFALEAISSSTISPTMGRGALNVMMQAGLIAFLAICLFMLLYYRLPGFVACIALLGQVVGILLAISIPQQTLTLQGIAGIILSIGMGVDANVIIAERIKEELNSGCSLPTALSNGFTRAFSAVLDGNVTVAIAAVILMIFGSGSMLSFGYSLLTGVILNALTGVTASRLMIGALSSMKPFKATWLYGKRRVKASV